MQGIIIENISNLYKIKQLDSKEIYIATARGKLKKDDIIPVVGDIVKFEITDKQKNEAVIEEIQERKVYIKRPKLANITQIIYVISIKNPKPDLLMLDKQLAFAEYLKIKSLIVINKIDLDETKQYTKIKETYENIGYKVIETFAKQKQGIDELKEELNGNINAFSGNSGVGKSTLINGIFNEDITKEGNISKKNKRGKNTTTITKLYEIQKDTYIADTPGFSTFDISEIPSKDLEKYFKEFKNHIHKCEFIGCTHIKEQNCGIKKAIENGEIENERYQRFCKIYQELKEKEERKKW